MKRVVVLGGYGGFGARLSHALLGDGLEVVVAGRNEAKARAFCTGHPNARPLRADRHEDLALMLEKLRPDLLIDAAGPFQFGSNAVPHACIAARVAYLDLADGREFVRNIVQLDQTARLADIPVVSGASSVPALSGAVIRHLSANFDAVHSIDIAISASSLSTAGPSVTRAILSYVGKPVTLWRAGEWICAWGWQDLRRERFDFGRGGSSARLTALADVPDHDIWPIELPGAPATTFRAGPEFALQTLSLWAASWLVRLGWAASLDALVPMFMRLHTLTTRFGTGRSAMRATVKGSHNRAATERIWTLIATEGRGPEIPSMAAILLARKVLAGTIASGARHAGGELELDDFAPLFTPLGIAHSMAERHSVPLYERVMGRRFANLPNAVQTIHRVNGDAAAVGYARVVRDRGFAARCVAAVMRMPPTGSFPLDVGFAERGGVET